MARSHRPSFKGCCSSCAGQKGRVRGQGHAARATVAEQRAVGRARRLDRGQLPDDLGASWLDWVAYMTGELLDGEALPDEPVVFERVDGHVPVDVVAHHDIEGWRNFRPPAYVCGACSDLEAGRYVPVSFCPAANAALAVLDAEEVLR